VVTAERAFLAGLGGGCSLPIAAYATIEGDRLHLHGRVVAPDGGEQVDVAASGSAELSAAGKLGAEVAKMALAKGVTRLLEMLR
jgi:hydroxymethylbilane synthase